MKAVFIDANPSLAAVAERLHRPDDLPLSINSQPDITSDQISRILGDAEILIVDHTAVPTDIARQCTALRHVVFLGTGARSYMDVEALDELGIEVHIIKGYGDTHRRGKDNFLRILDTLANSSALQPAARAIAIRQARLAALADPEGRALEGTLASHGITPLPPKAKPLNFVRKAAG